MPPLKPVLKKTCRECGHTKPAVDGFYIGRLVCKACVCSRERERKRKQQQEKREARMRASFLAGEEWRPCTRALGNECSDFGRARNAEKHILSPMLTFGYQRITINGISNNVHIHIATLVLEAFVGPAPTPEHTPDHINHDTTDNRLVNLRWATRAMQIKNRREPEQLISLNRSVIRRDLATDEETVFPSKACAAKAAGVKSVTIRTKDFETRKGMRYLYYYPDPPPDLPGEEWRPIRQKDGSAYPEDPKFDVSQWRIRDRRYKGTVIRTARDTVTERGKEKKVYPVVSINRQNRRIHELVATAWLGPRPDNMIVNHKNHDIYDARLDNLEWITASENTRQAYEAGRHDGGKHPPQPVIVNGAYYPSMTDAGKAMGGCSVYTVKGMIERGEAVPVPRRQQCRHNL